MTNRFIGLVAIGFVLVGCAASEVAQEEAASTEQGLAAAPGGDENCEVSCNKGTYACCNENGTNTDTCQCIPDNVGLTCDVGGYGASSCKSPGHGGMAPAGSAGATSDAK